VETAVGRARPETSQTLSRGIRLLELLAERPRSGGLTITELAVALGVGRPVVYRLVATLQEHQLVRRRPDGKVRLGTGVNRLAAAITPVVRDEARPILRELADTVGATAHLTVAEDDEALALVVVEPSWTDFHVAYRTGARHRLDQGAAGRAILAGRVGRTGPVSSGGELQSGAHGLALPITGTVSTEASVGVVSMQPLDTDQVAPQLAAAATKLAAILD
jgi:DNA-binding transcriptional ArsR family regulator